MLSLMRAQLQSLVRELRSPPAALAEKERERRKKPNKIENLTKVTNK